MNSNIVDTLDTLWELYTHIAPVLFERCDYVNAVLLDDCVKKYVNHTFCGLKARTEPFLYDSLIGIYAWSPVWLVNTFAL